MSPSGDVNEVPTVVPTGTLVELSVNELRPSPHNPRKLFDPEPLAALMDSIRKHGVLVPLTVFKLAGQKKYAIVDGERRFRCCSDLAKKGIKVGVPANVVDAPDKMAALLYMFNIHNFREQWELMPTAQALRSVIKTLGTDDTKKLTDLTGLGERQVERCKIILSFPAKYQQMSMEPDPKERIPSNFWVELHPVLEKMEDVLPALVADEGRWGITDRLVDKYKNKKIKSVIHFRRVLEAFDVQDDKEGLEEVADRLREYVLDPELETRTAFDGFILDPRRFQRAAQAADKFIRDVRGAKIDHLTEGKDELILKLTGVKIFVEELLAKLEGEDQPPEGGD